MSVSVDILDGGTSVTLTGVEKILTFEVEGGACLWVPESDFELKSKNITKNGTYHAVDDNCYAYDQVTVNVNSKTVGKKRKGDKDISVKVEVDDNGNLVETELPSYIRVVTPPNKLEYHDGENISKSGMVVRAYYADDREWGVVPNNETTLDPSTAQGDSEQKEYDKDGVHAIGFLCNIYNDNMYCDGYHANVPIAFGEVGYPPRRSYDFFDRTTVGYAYFTKFNGSLYYASFDATPVNHIYGTTNADGSGGFGQGSLAGFDSYNGQFREVRYYSEYNPFFISLIPESEVDPTITPAEGGDLGTQIITVGWTPPDGEEELTDTFDITVIT